MQNASRIKAVFKEHDLLKVYYIKESLHFLLTTNITAITQVSAVIRRKFNEHILADTFPCKKSSSVLLFNKQLVL